MLDIIFLILLLVFLIMFVSNLYLDNPVFGVIAGFWLIIIGLAVLVDGIKYQSGTTITTVGATTTMTATYTDITLPFQPAGITIAVFFIGLSIYIIYKNALEL